MRILNIGVFILAGWAVGQTDVALSAALAGRGGMAAVRPEAVTETVGRPGNGAITRASVHSWVGWSVETEDGPSVPMWTLDGSAQPGQHAQDDPGSREAAQAPSAKNRASEIVAGLGAQVRALGNYEMRFAVQTGDGTVEGCYAVSGDRYYMQMGEAEIYGDGAVRYEVNNRMREVTVDAVDTASRNILNNPTRAFDLAGDAFQPELLWERDGRAAVRLTPRPGQSALSALTVTIDVRRMHPLSLEYDFDGDRIRIEILDLQGGTPPPAAFDRTAYAGYEWIDFR